MTGALPAGMSSPLQHTGAVGICGRPLALAVAQTSRLVGLEAHPIRVEVCCTRGPAFFQMVGQAQAAVREARVRVAGALVQLGVLLDEFAVTVSLAPADLRKTDAALDLAIAVGLLAALGRLEAEALGETLLLGELSLRGTLQPVRGVLPLLEGAKRRGVTRAIVPSANSAEAALVHDMDVRAAPSLEACVEHLRGERLLPLATRAASAPRLVTSAPDLADLAGQAPARRALEVAAAGAHNLLMLGPPGGGKTLLARCMAGVLPALTFDEAIECTAIHSVSGGVDPARGVIELRPFRAPHHSVSEAALVGGGETPRPGEVSLAHNGVLFLDELAEFHRSTLEALRAPLEDGHVLISRARGSARFPARALVVAAANPCPCGYSGHPRRSCRCSPRQRALYTSRLSGPLVDRLDLHVHVPPVEAPALALRTPCETSASVRARVTAARAVQQARAARGVTLAKLNAHLTTPELRAVAEPDAEGARLLNRAIEQLGLSARAYVKVLRMARTVADLEGSEGVRLPHIAEAVQARLLDREPLC